MKPLLLFVIGCLGLPWAASQTGDLKKPEIYSLTIQTDIKYRFATSLVTSRVKNPADTLREAIFDVTLPNEAFITNFTLEIDGKITVGEIKKKEEALRQYVEAQERGESAGYIGTQHRETNKFNLAISVAALGKVTFNLTYQELLQRKNGLYEQVIYIDPGQLVPEMSITVDILESRNITELNVPPLRNDVGEDLLEMDIDSFLVTSRPTPKSAKIFFAPGIDHQLLQSSNGIAGKFAVRYDVERAMDAGDILMVNGYFVHFFAPDGLEAMPNDVLFILDKSGSMGGTKVRQMKEAMVLILGSMNEGDRINIMTFSSRTNLWQLDMADAYDEDEVESAKEFIMSIKTFGSTNIDLALKTGIEYLSAQRSLDENARARSPVIVFLTDGEATTGVTNTNEILENIKSTKTKNEINIPIFTLAFGKSADYDIVKKIAIQNGGFGKRIYEASDADMQIAGFYGEISMTLLKNLTFEYLDAPVSNLTQTHYETYFDGTECIVAGKLEDYNATDDNWIGPKMQVSTISATGPRVLILTNSLEPDLDDGGNLLKQGDYEKITEKVWAYLTIKQLLDKELATADTTKKLEYKKQILDLSLMYNFVTPLTSMVVTKDGKNDTTSEEQIAVPSITDTAAITSKSLSKTAYSSGQIQQRVTQRPGGPVFRPYSIGLPNSFSSRLQNYPVRDVIDDLGKAYFMPTQHALYDDVVPIRQTSVDNIKQKTTHKRRKNNKKRKDRKRNKKGEKGFVSPLQIELPASYNVDSPLCFNLFTKRFNDGDSFILYDDKSRDIRLVVEIAKRTSGRKMKVAGIRKLTLHKTDITNVTSSSSQQLNWTTAAFRIRTASTGDNFITVYIDDITLANLVPDGILGSILSKQISVTNNTNAGSSKKSLGWLHVGKKVVKSVQMNVPKIDGMIQNDKGRCWRAAKEAVIYKLNKHKFI